MMDSQEVDRAKNEKREEDAGNTHQKKEEEEQQQQAYENGDPTVTVTANDGESSTSISLTASMLEEASSAKQPLHHRSSLPLYTAIPRTTALLSSSSKTSSNRQQHQQQYKLQARMTSTNFSTHSNKRLKTAPADPSTSGDGTCTVDNYVTDVAPMSETASTSITNTSIGNGDAETILTTKCASSLSTPPDDSKSTLKPHPEPMVASSSPNMDITTTTAAATITTTRRSLISCGGSCWTDDDAYEKLPKTPIAPQQPQQQQQPLSASSSTASRSSPSLLRQNAMSPVPPGSAGSSVGSTAGLQYLLEVPPAPPTTPAAGGTTMITTIAIGSCATPLPYTGGFVQNADQLMELQQQKYNKKEQQQGKEQERDQLLQSAGAATPAPQKTQQQAAAAAALKTTTGGGSAAVATAISLSDDFSEWAVGDRYKLSRMLGRGSYGEVAQAIDLYQGRADAFVAIKRIFGPFEQEVDAVRLFREIHILRLLRTLGTNDCIVPLLDVVQPPTDDLNDFHDLYLVFDYVDTDLYKLIMSPQYLTTEHIQTFLYQMLIGLKYIHSCNVIHRDLKPANILLNEDCSLKICDFGLARIVDEISVANSSSKKDEYNIDDNNIATSVIVKKASGRSCSISEQFLSSDDDDGNNQAPAKLPLTRQLTKHVVTRWYRAPELILIQPYTTAVDIWSMGCIFAELLSMQEGSVPGYQDRTPLFPGGACYPLSGDTDNEERLDQLIVIFGVIGTPSMEDIAEVGEANEYIKKLKPIKPKSLKDIYPAADPNALDLLQKMLKFNPKQRCTAGEALEHKFFSGIRREEMETSVSKPMKSPVFLNEQDIDIEILKQKTYEEALWFRDNSTIRPNLQQQHHPSVE